MTIENKQDDQITKLRFGSKTLTCYETHKHIHLEESDVTIIVPRGFSGNTIIEMLSILEGIGIK